MKFYVRKSKDKPYELQTYNNPTIPLKEGWLYEGHTYWSGNTSYHMDKIFHDPNINDWYVYATKMKND